MVAERSGGRKFRGGGRLAQTHGESGRLYCTARRDAKKGKPFFLYLPLTSPHTPILPTKEWQGRSGLNSYADFVMQTDATVGEVLDALEEQGLAQNALVILASDNGCSPQADFPELRSKGHDPSYHFRGHKADIFEGGHRIPFLVRWPGRVKAGTTSDQLICLSDFLRPARISSARNYRWTWRRTV